MAGPVSPGSMMEACSTNESPANLQDLTKRNVELIARLEQHAQDARTQGERVADLVAAGVGSWTFLIIQSVLFVVWMSINILAMTYRWDQYPFVLLNLVLSFQAAYATPILLMSQNRQGRLDQRREHLDLQVNLLAEQENTEQLRLLRLICEKSGIDTSPIESRPLEESTRPEDIVDQIKQRVESDIDHPSHK